MFETWWQGVKRQICEALHVIAMLSLFIVISGFYLVYFFDPDPLTLFLCLALALCELYSIIVRTLSQRHVLTAAIFFAVRLAMALAALCIVTALARKVLNEDFFTFLLGALLLEMLRQYYSRRPPFPEYASEHTGIPYLPTGSEIRRRWRF